MRTATMTLMALALVCASASAAGTVGHSMTVLVDGLPSHEYHHNGTIYIEALRGRDFTIRLTNPTPYRVAVALSVDGLNTIDARHSDAWNARKWVLDPWETTFISGWQVDQDNARRFFFTGEKNSYGAALGQTANLGVIEAVFYRERRARYDAKAAPPPSRMHPAPSSAGGRGEANESAAPSDDYAATGMGQRDRHEVESVDIDLDPHPVASARVRYEFRPQLVKLGVLLDKSPLERREGARGFGGFCPEP